MTPSKGYVVVASCEEFYYYSALNLIQSIKDFDSENKVCLVVQKSLLDTASNVADDIILCKDHKRSKIWGMANSPYDQTFYIDADCEVIHPDITQVFDKFDKFDILFTVLSEDRSYIFREYTWGNGGRFWWCGGTCLYDKTKPLVKDFLEDWYDLTVKQYAGAWWPTDEKGNRDYITYPKTLTRWDQFSLWWLCNKVPKYADLKIGRLDGKNDSRWNFFSKYKYDHCEDPVILHYSNSDAKNNFRINHRP